MSIFNFLKKKQMPAEVPPERHFEESVSQAVEIFKAHSNADWKSICELLAEKLGDRELALDLYRFVPIAYGRMFLSDVKFPETFVRVEEGSNYVEYRFDENPLYVDVSSFAKNGAPLSQNELMAILNHSSEFQAINNALNSGSKLEDLVLGAPVFQ